MSARLCDELLDHEKIAVAGRAIGKNGRVIAIGFYTMALMWTNRHLTDGHLSIDVLEGFGSHVMNPLAVAGALEKAHLFDKVDDGYRIHDFHDHNPKASDVRESRKTVRAERSRAGKHGAAVRWRK